MQCFPFESSNVSSYFLPEAFSKGKCFYVQSGFMSVCEGNYKQGFKEEKTCQNRGLFLYVPASMRYWSQLKPTRMAAIGRAMKSLPKIPSLSSLGPEGFPQQNALLVNWLHYLMEAGTDRVCPAVVAVSRLAYTSFVNSHWKLMTSELRPTTCKVHLLYVLKNNIVPKRVSRSFLVVIWFIMASHDAQSYQYLVLTQGTCEPGY